MTRTKLSIGLVSALAVALAVFAVLRLGKGVAVPDAGKPSAARTAQRPHVGAERPGASAAKAGRFQKRSRMQAAGKRAGVGQPAAGAGAAGSGKEASANKTAAAEKAVESWENLIDKLSELTDAPTQERMVSVKEAFDTLDKNDQVDAINTALNLLPDEQFTSLYGILLDKTENEEVLDAIFSDALNRPEEIKVPLMKELAKDKTHPMYFESARILDATGESDETTTGEADEK